ncbi:hypothetical protein EPN83_00780 [Patescibacteria group bacterium]|nr:MAG: hypothetical protein EPN83_00780 [Patescibacteria group bacterium]
MSKGIQNIGVALGNYIAGFTDGEGSFNVSIKHRLDYRDEWKLCASFNISQRDRVILAKIKDTLGCGTLRERKDGVIYYEVTNIKSLQEIIVPFFQRFGFLSARKKKNFSIFKEIVEKMYRGDHLNHIGRKEILQLREKLNDDRGRKRTYSLSDVYKEESSETIRKTPENGEDIVQSHGQP